ncbi:MAG: hypothetical protein IPK66_08660 [Rhodospirillales bacterium]|nr:hypothetical protein [Rhodospirillales bacterium]
MALASVETIARRTRMIADGTCSPTEYRRMVAEKAQAAQDSAGVLARLRIENIASGRGAAKTLRAILDPWHSRVTANARRLRKT